MQKNKTLYRSKTDRKVAGLVGGLSEYMDIDVNFMRVVTLFLIMASGIVPGLVAYLVCAAFVPVEEGKTNAKA